MATRYPPPVCWPRLTEPIIKEPRCLARPMPVSRLPDLADPLILTDARPAKWTRSPQFKPRKRQRLCRVLKNTSPAPNMGKRRLKATTIVARPIVLPSPPCEVGSTKRSPSLARRVSDHRGHTRVQTSVPVLIPAVLSTDQNWVHASTVDEKTGYHHGSAYPASVAPAATILALFPLLIVLILLNPA